MIKNIYRRNYNEETIICLIISILIFGNFSQNIRQLALFFLSVKISALQRKG